MSIFDSIGKSIKNFLSGSDKKDDSKDEWFSAPHPHDSMPIANGSNRYAPPEKLVELEETIAETNPRPEEDVAEWFSEEVAESNESDNIEEEKSIHQKMYEIATAKYNPFAVGGSENIQDSDLLGGSENRL